MSFNLFPVSLKETHSYMMTNKFLPSMNLSCSSLDHLPVIALESFSGLLVNSLLILVWLRFSLKLSYFLLALLSSRVNWMLDMFVDGYSAFGSIFAWLSFES